MKYLNDNGLDYFWSKIKENIYPIGSIYMSVSSTSPATLFGGTWEQIAQGRTLVGVDTNDSDFNTVQKTGGSKNLQSHTHKMKEAVVTGRESVGTAMGIANGSWYTFKENGGVGTGYDTESAGTGTSGNLQPYFTCYIWKRTA